MHPVIRPTFRIKPYAHPKYKFVVRAKLAGKWKRSYFKSEAEAAAYAGKQNASLEKQMKRQRKRHVRSDGYTNGARNWHELEKSNGRSTVSSQALSRKAVVVLGMHRSGTSALCGALDVLGVNFGEHLMPANEANPKGYWEHLEIVRLHDDLLRALGSHWDDDRPLPADWLEREVTKETQSCLLTILQRDFGQTALLGLKDPRMSRLMPLWFPLFEKLGIEPYFILVVRHPSEVAQSLAKRDGLDHARSHLLWLQHTLEAETVMRRHKRAIVDYGELLDDPVAALGRVRSELKLDFRVPSRARASLRKFLEPSLRHHKARARKREKAADRVPPLVIEVYEAIRKGTTPGDVARRISPLREQLARTAGLFYPRLNVLERQVESLDQTVEKSGESAPRGDELVRLDIFRAVGEEYSATHSDARYFMSGSWKLLQIDLPSSAGAADKPLRIDPVTYPAVIDIAEMALKRTSTGEILWAATGSTEFAALTVGGTACRLAHESYLRILSFGNDPQLLLPQSTTALGDSPLRLELSILVDAGPEAITTALAEMQQEPRTEVLGPAAPLMVIFADQGNGYSDEVSLAAPVQMDVSQTIRFEHLEKFHTNPRARLRIDPIDRPAFLILSSIRIIRDRDDFVLYSAESASDFEKIDVSSGVLKHPDGDNLFLVTTDSDPQIYLPILDNLGTASYRLEITLEPQSAARRVTLRHRRALEERAQLAPKLEAAQSQLENLQAASGGWEKTFSELQASLESSRTELRRLVSQSEVSAGEISKLQNALEQAHAETTRLSSELETERSQNREQQAQAKLDREQIASLENELCSSQRAGKEFEQQKNIAERELEETRRALHKQAKLDTEQIASLENELRSSQRAGKEFEQQKNVAESALEETRRALHQNRDELFKLDQNVKNVVEVCGLTRPSLHDSGSTAAVLIQPLLREIQQIRKRRFLWKACRLIRRRILRNGANEMPPKPKVIAKALEEKLQELQRTLKSEGTSSAAALATLAELIVLRNRARQELASLSVGSLLRLQQATVTARESVSFAASRFSTLFDPEWYLGKNPDVKEAGMDPLQHYLRSGARECRNPHPLFETKWYLSQKPELTNIGLTPLEHYVCYGAREGRSPHPEFDSQFYIKNHPESVIGEMTPLAHYLTVGWRLGYRPNPRFDPQFYLRTYPDVAAANIEPFTHFVSQGQTEGRKTTEEKVSFEAYRPAFDIPSEPTVFADPSLVPTVKAIAFYLPQFHRIPQNDAWWGEGFTEWTNVRRGRANFEGHYQPHVPSALGYYDLAEDDVLEKQARLARTAGLYGFCFYYYWFGGQILLDLPVRRMVETGKPDFPFCICWANENWTRCWDGQDNEVLIAQQHSPEDDIAFIEKIESIFALNNYIRVDGKPMLLVYRPSLLPDAAATLDRWRRHARKTGRGELHLVMVRSFSERGTPQSYGFDAAVQFPPHLPGVMPITPSIPGQHEEFTGFVYDYTNVRRTAVEQFAGAADKPPLYPGVMPSWDNTARQQRRSTIWVNSSPEAYCEWLTQIVGLVRDRYALPERFVFINAWNEWAEGCHLEPDERFGYAWLNATSVALRESSLASLQADGSQPHPEPPLERGIEVKPLTGKIKVILSVLLYYREDIILGFLRKLLPQVLTASRSRDFSCELFLSFNYEPTSVLLEELEQLISEVLPARGCVHIVKNGFNLGFGAGHNAIFERTESDVFAVMNSDVQMQDDHWLYKLAECFRTSNATIVGLTENASRLREDGCGVLIQEKDATFDFLDGSVLAIRSDLASQFGLFSPSFDYFYFEDVDLNLRYRQMGLRVESLDIPCIHKRSSSTQLLPAYAVESVLDRNRTRLFERWGKYLTNRTLENRLAVRFRHADRQLQCASLPAIFGLLNEHPTAILDLWGVHEQLVRLFQHERIRLIPYWQILRESDYLRSYELHHQPRSERPRALQIAEQMLVEPDFEQARIHLTSLAPSTVSEKDAPRALLYLARQEVLFAGRQPDPLSFLTAQDILKQRNFWVQCYSEYGIHEVESVTEKQRENWKYTAWSDGLDFLTDLAQSEVLVTSDGWAAELGQLLNKRTFVWLGAKSVASLIWNDRYAGAFVDNSLTCLGCHHRFGTIGRNICLRGDVACMRESLAEPFAVALSNFVDSHAATNQHAQRSSESSFTTRLTRSEQETLAGWPRSSASSVLVLTPVNPNLNKDVLERARMLAERAISGMRGCSIVYDDQGKAPVRGFPHPHRQAAIAALRQAMIERHLNDEQWVFWVDADLVEYPANLLDELIARAEGGIAAPLVLMEGDIREPAYPAGFGPGRFYDIAGFVEDDRWARFTPPYFNQPGPVYRLDSVGSCYLVNADLYRWGAKHEIDSASSAFVSNQSPWAADTIRLNQQARANSYTEHYSLCQFARQAGLPVQAFADLVAYHQKP